MRQIPMKLRRDMSADPYYSKCARKDHNCAGPITWEHAFIYAGRQINARWAIIPLCWYHHLGKGLNKAINQFIALSRATDDDLLEFSRVDWQQTKIKLKTEIHASNV